MLPFPRLFEYGNVIDNSAILDIDFTDAALGSTAVVDKAGSQFVLMRTTVGVVEYDTDIGANVYNMKMSNGYYRSVDPIMGTKLDLTRYSNFEIQCRYKAAASPIQNIFEVGNYDSRRITGYVCQLNQFASTHYQMFVDWGENYARVLGAGVNTGQWNTVTVRYYRGDKITLHDTITGVTQSYPAYTLVSNSSQYVGLFGSYVNGDIGGNTYSFVGKIQYLKIRRI